MRSADAKEKFVKDFAKAWTKVMDLDRFDLVSRERAAGDGGGVTPKAARGESLRAADQRPARFQSSAIRASLANSPRSACASPSATAASSAGDIV